MEQYQKCECIHIIKLKKTNFIDNWDTITDGIFYAVDYLRKHLSVPVSGLLPYNAILVPLTYFFIKRKGIRPTSIQNKLLKQYFFWAGLSERFSSGADGKIALDLKRMDKILKEKIPSYRGEEIKLSNSLADKLLIPHNFVLSDELPDLNFPFDEEDKEDSIHFRSNRERKILRDTLERMERG